MPAFLASVTYSAVVFGDDEEDARRCAPDVVRSLSVCPVHVELEPLEQEPEAQKETQP
jgi:hypothetical protein